MYPRKAEVITDVPRSVCTSLSTLGKSLSLTATFLPLAIRVQHIVITWQNSFEEFGQKIVQLWFLKMFHWHQKRFSILTFIVKFCDNSHKHIWICVWMFLFTQNIPKALKCFEHLTLQVILCRTFTIYNRCIYHNLSVNYYTQVQYSSRGTEHKLINNSWFICVSSSSISYPEILRRPKYLSVFVSTL